MGKKIQSKAWKCPKPCGVEQVIEADLISCEVDPTSLIDGNTTGLKLDQ